MLHEDVSFYSYCVLVQQDGLIAFANLKGTIKIITEGINLEGYLKVCAGESRKNIFFSKKYGYFCSPLQLCSL